ncbi:hypothetical protein ABF179_002325 [Flavobacterium psychrophilum]
MFIIEKFNVADNIKPEHFIEDLVLLLDTHYNNYMHKIESNTACLTDQYWKKFSLFLDDLYQSYKDDLDECFSKFQKTDLNKESVELKLKKFRSNF